MNEQLRAIQTLIEWIDEHAVENPHLIDMAREIGYSPYYCSEQFRRACGISTEESYYITRATWLQQNYNKVLTLNAEKRYNNNRIMHKRRAIRGYSMFI